VTRAVAPLLAILGSFGLAVPVSAQPRPNIVLCLADDWSFPHAGCYGDHVVRTPNFDRVAADGCLFTAAFCVSPTCTASRAAILTGQPPHRLEEGANLWGILPRRYETFPDRLEQAGYAVGYCLKGWGPGSLEGSGRTRNPAGPQFTNFDVFLKTVPADKPFFFWHGSHRPHRAYVRGSGKKAGLNAAAITVPPYLPNAPEVRDDILDYYAAVEQFDRELGAVLKSLEDSGRTGNTLLVVTSDNGWPMPRCKANLYDGGTREPLAIRWPGRVPRGKVVDNLVSQIELAPTFLAAAGLPASPDHVGASLMRLFDAGEPASDGEVSFERERHANVRKGDLSYPIRAVRTRRFLYVRNFRPDRWPAGDPERYFAVGRFGDCDPGPSKDYVLDHREESSVHRFFDLAFARRPAEELYDLTTDPDQLTNVAGRADLAGVKASLQSTLDAWMRRTKDPRLDPADDRFDRFKYFGQPTREERDK
jgi:arylsulfatase A-like enzyme